MNCLCNSSFISQYCFINDLPVNIKDFIQNKDKYTNQEIKCSNGHLLTLVNGKIRAPHFRHKDSSGLDKTNPMTDWHAEWQGNFPVTEKTFEKLEGQIKVRRADVVLNNKQILEIQHSNYSREVILEKKNDMALHGIEVLWLIDGNYETINVKYLEYANRYFLEFKEKYLWKYKSFIDYEYIYIEIDEQIFKVHPNKVKCNMIDVEAPKTKNDFINSLQNNTNLWSDEEPEQCNLYIKQQGAGNGKTYGIIQMLASEEMQHYKSFIFVTKQHTAKHIIKEELVTQHRDGKLDFSDFDYKDYNKQYIINYYNNKYDKKCEIIISTIDSLAFAIGNKDHTYYDKFQGLLYSIINNCINTSANGSIKYCGKNIKLNKETLLIVDEFQDLPKYYGDAILQIMRNKYIDVYVVGDKLQSIGYEHNSFTYFSDPENNFPYIKKHIIPPSNICRRFYDNKLIDFVNTLIPFESFNLPKITPYKTLESSPNSLVIFRGKNIKINDTLNNEIGIIMEHYKNEVINNKRVPEDFLIVTPFAQKNPLIDALTLSINIFWEHMLKNEYETIIENFMSNENWESYWKNNTDFNSYCRFAIFHKSEQGTSINLEESKFSTRIVTTHASKGDGRNVVFAIGFTEGALKCFSIESEKLVYYSLLHVALTRMKQKLYIRVETNGDHIDKIITEYQLKNNIEFGKNETPFISLSNKLTHKRIIGHCTQDENIYKSIDELIITKKNINKKIETEVEKQIIDMANHNIRYASLKIYLFIEILYSQKNENVKRQIFAIFKSIADNCIINTIDNYKEYNDNIKDQNIVVLRLSENGKDYIKYAEILKKFMYEIRKKILSLEKTKMVFCPLECIILNYMLDIKKNGIYSTTSIIDIYNIIDLYSHTFNQNLLGHNNCICKHHFVKSKKMQTDKEKKLKEFLMDHYQKMSIVPTIVEKFNLKYSNINWLIDHYIQFGGKNTNFKYSHKLDLIGHNEDHVFIGYIKPQYNELNINDILINSIIDTFIIQNIQHKKKGKICENYNRYKNKKIITCIFTLDKHEPVFIDWYALEQKNISNSITNNKLKDMFDSDNSECEVDLIDQNENIYTSNNPIDLIKENDEVIRNILKDFIYNHYSVENKSYYLFFKRFRDQKTNDPKKLLNLILDEHNKIYENDDEINTIKYFKSFLENLKSNVDKGDYDLYRKYKNQDNFINDLNEKLNSSIMDYLNLNVDNDNYENEYVSDDDI